VSQVLSGGHVLTLHGATPRTDLLAVDDDGRVAARPAPGAEVVNLRGACVVPGLNDAHVHFPTWSLAQHQVRLEGARSVDDAVAAVAGGLPSTPPGGWLRGLGWRDADWSERPHRRHLDDVAGYVPVALTSKDYHSLWLNGAALARCPDLNALGDVVERDDRGEPTGVLRERAAWAFRDLYARPGIDEMVEAARGGLRLANARGVTAVHDKDGWLGSLEVFQRLLEQDELSLRVLQSIPHERLGHLAALGLRTGQGHPLLRLGHLKVFMDGALGSATALLLDGEERKPGQGEERSAGAGRASTGATFSRASTAARVSGVEITTSAELEQIVRAGADAGFPVAVHAIGDAANRAALDAFARSRDAWAPLGLRQRIEHAQLLAPDDVARFAELGVAASVQFSHAPSDRDLADRLWEGRRGAYAYRSLLDAGALLANGSDAPVEELNPLAGIAAGVRRTIDRRPAWRPEQAVTVEEALLAATVGPAWLAGEDSGRGTLVPGMQADLAVLDRDPLRCPADELPEIRVLGTMLAGRWVYVAPDAPFAPPGT